MAWRLDKNQPIYLQLAEEIQSRIVSGIYSHGEKIDSVRDLAAEAGVNPNTMQRALTELERNGLLRTERTAGRFVTEDETLITQVRRTLAHEKIEVFIRELTTLGYHPKEINGLLQAYFEEENHE